MQENNGNAEKKSAILFSEVTFDLYLESQKSEGLHVHTLREVHTLLVLTTSP